MQEREGWTRTIDDLKKAVNDTITAAAEAERVRIMEKKQMQEQMQKQLEVA